MTSPAPAMDGTARGETNATASTWRTPAATRASMSATRDSTVTGASACSPSRGPTSRIATDAGRLLIGRLGGCPEGTAPAGAGSSRLRAAHGQDGDVVGERLRGEVPGRLEQHLAQGA